MLSTEAALRFPDAFEPLAKILEIGGSRALLMGRACCGCFAGVTSRQRGCAPMAWSPFGGRVVRL